MLQLARPVAVALAVSIAAAACSGSIEVSIPPEAPEQAERPSPAPSPDAATPAPAAPSTPSTVATPEPAPVVPAFAGDDEPLSFDPDVRLGVLDNGLTYYIRRNTAPGGRVELRLAVDVGSGSEDSDQSAVAHFLEHMMFNGTQRYPANELIAVLEEFGSEFGPDVNAYTSFDETVYELSVATDDSELIEEGLDVLREWAGNATIDPAEVTAERGVVLEEWRLRDQGVGGRINEVYVDLLTSGTGYEGRQPIGSPEAISAMTAEVLRRFYQDWYRPDLMAVVVVGDVDVDEIETLITDRFSDLSSSDSQRSPADPPIPDSTEFRYARLDDPEFPSAYIELIYAGPAPELSDVGDYRRFIAFELASGIITERFDDDVSRGDVPYLRAYTSVTPLAREIDTPGLLAEGPAEALEQSFELLLVELERVRRDGFSEAEVARAVDGWRASVEQAFAGRETTQDAEYASEYVEHFVADAPSLSWDEFVGLETRLLGDMTGEYLRAVYLDNIAGRTPQVVVVGPAEDAADLPSEAVIRDLLQRVPGSDVPARSDETRTIEALMEVPEPAAVVQRERIPHLEATSLRFENGVTVLLKETTIGRNSFSIGATNPGGLSVLSLEDLPAAFVMTDVVTASGVGELDQVELDRLLANRVVSVELAVDETVERVFASGSTDDAEIVLQLINRYLASPRVRQSALRTAVAELEPFAENPQELPFLAPSVALFDARYGGDPRYRLIPAATELRAVTPSQIESVFSDLLGDAAGAVFAIVGDFDGELMEELAARYLGTLPADGEPDTSLDRQPGPPPGIVERRLEVGQDPQASTTLMISVELELDRTGVIELAVLENVLSARLRDRLREALGATYSPAVAMTVFESPDQLVETVVEVSADPDGVDTITAEILAVLDDLRGGGLSQSEVVAARELVRRDFELVSNGFWIEQLLYEQAHPDSGVLSVSERVTTAAGVSVADLNTLIEAVLPADRYIAVTLVPDL